MDPITHTIIAMSTIFIAYVIGYFMGKRRGAILGMAAVIEWVQAKAGIAKWEEWNNEDNAKKAD